MFNKYSLWKKIFLFFSSIYLTIAISNQRTNLAQRHPCYSINKRLEPYIKWTEKLVSSQYRVQKDACGQTRSTGLPCCTNEIMNSYASSLGNDLKILFDIELDQLKQLLRLSTTQIDVWTKEYLSEARRLTISSVETLFGTNEYHKHIHHSLNILFNILNNPESTDNDVSKSAINLISQLIISSYRRFMTTEPDLIFDERFEKCLVNTAFAIEALPKQPELLYTLTSAFSLTKILRTLFIYIDADIERLKTTELSNSYQCLQRYVRETLCPICVSSSSSLHYDNNNDYNEPLCENDCHYVIKNCFNQTKNPYVDFALMAQGYSNVIKQIEESIDELKLVERLSKFHISLYDMFVNATNTKETYNKLQTSCPNSHGKPFSPILSLSPITSERRDLVIQWNESLHNMLNQLQSSINNLNTSLTNQIITDICSNSNYAVKSNRCTQIDQHMPSDFTQWPLPSNEYESEKFSNPNDESTQNQINDLNKRLDPIQRMIISLRPKKKFSYIEYIPNFDYDNNIDTNDNENQLSISNIETDDNQQPLPFSEQLYKKIDQEQSASTTAVVYPEETNVNHSQLMTYNILLYSIVFIIQIIYSLNLVQ